MEFLVPPGSTTTEPTADAAEPRIQDSARIAALRDLDLIGPTAQEAIDRLSRLAAKLLGVPVSLTSLVESDRQVFLGQFGLDGVYAERRETPLSHSFCKHAVSSRRPLVIRDARTEPIVAGNGAIEDFGVIAYAGVPLILSGGEAVGALCAIDHRPRDWSDEDLETLEQLAAIASEILSARATLVHNGLHDRLTGLPNRELLVASCDEFLAGAGPGEKVAVLCAGIDHFNMVNEAFGAEKADEVLRAAADRLSGAVRETDVFGRLRGDVFAMVAPEIRDEADALDLASRVHRLLSEAPLEIEGEPLSLGVTLGIAIGGVGATGSDLISSAANAMREAKRSQGRVRVAEHDRTESATAYLRMREELHLACERGEMQANFQPIVALESGETVGFEALARWHSVELGRVSPEDFIPLAELTSDIVGIGECMRTQSAAFAAGLREAAGEEMRLTLNVSPLELNQPDFAAALCDAFVAEGLSGASLGVEITEGTLLESGGRERRNLARLREFGARILLDDFGTGYSSLGYLRDFQVDTIKIDRSFVSKIADDRHSAALIQAILAMARGMDMEIVAEGIETEEQAKLLRLLGCRYGQGFGLGRPASAADALAGLPRRPS